MQGQLDYYENYAAALAGWGYAVLQYDLECCLSLAWLRIGLCMQLQPVAHEVRHAGPAALREWACSYYVARLCCARVAEPSGPASVLLYDLVLYIANALDAKRMVRLYLCL